VLLVETAGNNLLIGGTGQATIDSGSGEDIVIAGSTTYDNNQTALLTIETYWENPSNGSESARVSVLSSTGTPTGNYKLNSSTVTHAGASDTLVLGSTSDWVFYRLTGTNHDNKSGTPAFQTFI
jgi:hypothetical protein